jgi:uncharacterized membrane protein
MFNLEEQIATWRKQMAAGGIKAPAVLDELESHLREEIERQINFGTNEERAFKVAEQKIGSAAALKNEFKKTSVRGVIDMLAISVAVLLVVLVILLYIFTAIECYLTLRERLEALAALGCVLLIMCNWPRLVPHLPVISQRRKRFAIEIGCFLLGAGLSTLLAQIILHYAEGGPDRILPAGGSWCMLPAAIGLSLACGFEYAARRASVNWSVSS